MTPPSFPVAIAAHGWHTCALTQKGELFCWGSFRSNDDIDVLWQRARPAKVELPKPVVSFAVGVGHNCAVTDDGKMYCWGRNRFGQLGNGSTVPSLTPVEVVGVSAPVRSLTLGLRHSCALADDGSVKCWGYGPSVGVGGVVDVKSPVNVPGVAPASILSAGDLHTCAWASPGKMKCWGDNGAGQLGDGTVESGLPVDATAPPGLVSRVVANDETTFLTTESGTLYFFGRDFPNRLAVQLIFVPAPKVPLLIEPAVANEHACGVTQDHNAVCWGRNQAFAVGTALPAGTMVDAPLVVPGIPDKVDSVAVGRYHSCVLTRAKRVYCWGANDSDQLGLGDAGAPTSIPTEVVF